MELKINHPAAILAALGAVSGIVSLYAPGPSFDFGYGETPHPGLFMVLAGVWFGLVAGFGVWRWGSRSYVAAAAALAGTWIAWELAVNLAMQIEGNWLTAAMPDVYRTVIGGFAAGAVGAFVTWAGGASLTPALRQVSTAATFVAIGALFGLLLPCMIQYNYPSALLLPWQAAVAAALGFGLTRQQAP